MRSIEIYGARTHNLKVDKLILPRDQLIIITGLSGSGKSSLAFDTLYAEGQRRYVNSLSAYARQFLSVMDKPEVEHIDGLSPAISIEQKTTSHNPRSTVGTVTEILDYCRLLFARAGEPKCPVHNLPLDAEPVSQIVDTILGLPEGMAIYLYAPLVQNRKGDHKRLLADLIKRGFVRALINGELIELEDAPLLDAKKKHDISVLIDRIKVSSDKRIRLADSIETALNLSEGLLVVQSPDTDYRAQFSSKYACSECGYGIAALEPRLFSFNNPVGACESCDGLGVKEVFSPLLIIQQPTLGLSAGAIFGWSRRHPYYHQLLECLAEHYAFSLETPYQDLPEPIQQILLYGSGEDKIRFDVKGMRGRTVRRKPFEGIIPFMTRKYEATETESTRDELAQFVISEACHTCKGARLQLAARHVFVGDRSLPELMDLPINDLHTFISELNLPKQRQEIADKITKEITTRLQFLLDIGLSYLTLGRSADTLSGGEAQRIRLASQIGAGLVGVMYVLDEPSIGLHPRDNKRLIDMLEKIRDIGNTVIVVEHDEEAILAADHLVDMGPGAGVHGGRVVAEGTPADVLKHPDSLTGQYLSGKLSITAPSPRKSPEDKWLKVINASGHNLQNIDVSFPVGLITCITGVSGSGKSTLINQTLYPHVRQRINRAALGAVAACEGVEGIEHFDKVVCIDQSPIGRTPRSNPATYTGLFTPIRTIFSSTSEARTRGYSPGRFSFNVKGGRCEACQGDGLIRIEMHFLSDMYVMCDTCLGTRYNRETLEILYKGKSIHEVLSMTIEEAAEFFSAIPAVSMRLNTLISVGLGYIKLGQSATTLSGGEAQRVKLSKELSKRATGRTLYILDEPTTGLHFHDVQQLLNVLYDLNDRGNTIIIIEHNLDMIKHAHWVIDLGPEGGAGGGRLIVAGTPEEVANCKDSHTGRFLKTLLEK